MGAPHVLGAGVALSIFYVLSKMIYNIYFHPLAKFPGPKYMAISNVYYVFAFSCGDWHLILDDLHKKYGSVVRYAPNDLSFSNPQSFQDVYGHVKNSKQTFIKSEMYNHSPTATLSITSQRDPEKHRETRKSLSHALSAKALRTQTDVVLKYVDMWIAVVRKLNHNEKGINVEECYNWLTFDIIGDLAFGEAFGSIEKAEGHPWIRTLQKSLVASMFVDIFRRVPLLKVWPTLIRPSHLLEQRVEHFRLSEEKVERRMAMGNDRDDFFAHLLSEKASDSSLNFLTAQANTLVIAGSETTATFLAGTTFYLLKNPSTLDRLTIEVRAAFSDSREIDGDSTQNLAYLFAVIEEGLRMFPPVPFGLPRLSPGAEVDGHYVPEGAAVSVSPWSTTHNEKYFFDAQRFLPERWLPQSHPLYDPAYKNDVKDASKPFSLGPRGCLGINLAYMEMKIILARLVWEFDWELMSKDLEWESETKIKPLWQKPALWVKFKATEG